MIKSKTNNKKTFIFDNVAKWPLIIFILVFIVYGNTLKNQYSFDDEFVIKNNLVMGGIKSIPEIITSPYYQNDEVNFGYRPVTKTIFALEYELFGKNPFISHLINILLFAIITILISGLLQKILLPYTGSVFLFLVIILWITHPIHTEVIASLKNREELLYLLFSLLSLKYFIRFIGNNNSKLIIPALLLFILSFLTKQSAISFALIIPMVLWFLYFKPGKKIQILKNNYKIIITLGLLLITSYVLMKIPAWFFPSENVPLLTFENPLHADKSFGTRIAVSAYSMLINLKLLLFPHPLVFYYGQFTIPEVKPTDFLVIFSIFLHLSLVALIGYLLKNKNVLIFGILFYVLGILPFSNYFMPINGIVAERFLFAPSLGFIIVLVFILFNLTKTSLSINSVTQLKKNFHLFFIIITLGYSIKTIDRNATWKDSLTLFSNDIKYLENSVKANDILAQELMDRMMVNLSDKRSSKQLKSRIDSIVLLYKRSLSLYPENPKALNNLANIYYSFFKNPSMASECLLKAYQLKQTSSEVTFNLALCYDKMNKSAEANAYYYKTVELNPKNYNAWQGLVNNYFKQNMPDSVHIICRNLLKTDSSSSFPYKGLGNYYLYKKDTSSALKYFEKAHAIDPSDKILSEKLKNLL